MRRRIIVVVVALLAIGAAAWWWFESKSPDSGPLVLYGNVDLRQIDLAFTDSGRIADVLVDEGATVKKDQVLARLDTRRLDAQMAEAEAQAASAAANAHIAKLTFDRLQSLSGGSTVTQSQIDSAKAASDAANAQLDGAAAQVALLQQQKKDADLRAPIDSVVRSRLLEPGEIASAQRPVFSLAVVQPKWVRAYVAEPDLTRVRPGAAATVEVDGGSGLTFDGHVGFISPVAEFTPRTIQTEELRTSLVYEVRVLVDDPDNRLRLGMPATVRLQGEAGKPAS